jgi:hypothetical protein
MYIDYDELKEAILSSLTIFCYLSRARDKAMLRDFHFVARVTDRILRAFFIIAETPAKGVQDRSFLPTSKLILSST